MSAFHQLVHRHRTVRHPLIRRTSNPLCVPPSPPPGHGEAVACGDGSCVRFSAPRCVTCGGSPGGESCYSPTFRDGGGATCAPWYRWTPTAWPVDSDHEASEVDAWSTNLRMIVSRDRLWKHLRAVAAPERALARLRRSLMRPRTYMDHDTCWMFPENSLGRPGGPDRSVQEKPGLPPGNEPTSRKLDR